MKNRYLDHEPILIPGECYFIEFFKSKTNIWVVHVDYVNEKGNIAFHSYISLDGGGAKPILKRGVDLGNIEEISMYRIASPEERNLLTLPTLSLAYEIF